MKILNTRKPEEPNEEDLELLRRLFKFTLDDPKAIIIIKGVNIEVDNDGNIIIKKV